MRLFAPNVDKMEKRKDIAGLIKVMRKDKDLQIRIWSARALGRLKDQQAIEPLLEVLGNKDYPDDLRFHAIVALGDIGDKLAVEPLIAILHNSWTSSWVRCEAANTLGIIGDPAAIEDLFEVAKSESDVRYQAKLALEKFDDPRAKKALEQLRKKEEKRRHVLEEERKKHPIPARSMQQPESFSEKEYVICTNCGAGYNTEMVAESIFLTSPFMADMKAWNTRIICKNCKQEIWVEGSYRRVFGQPRPR